MINEDFVNYHFNPSGLTSRYTLFYFYIALVLYFSLELLLNFVLNLYIRPWVGKSFKFAVFRLLENVFCKSKN